MSSTYILIAIPSDCFNATELQLLLPFDRYQITRTILLVFFCYFPGHGFVLSVRDLHLEGLGHGTSRIRSQMSEPRHVALRPAQVDQRIRRGRTRRRVKLVYIYTHVILVVIIIIIINDKWSFSSWFSTSVTLRVENRIGQCQWDDREIQRTYC